MAETFLDTFSAGATLNGHTADSGFGAWTVVGARDFAIGGGLLVLAKPLGTGESGVWGQDRATNLVSAYTLSAEAYFDLYVPDDANFTYLQVWFRDKYGVAALGFEWWRSFGGHTPIWQIQGGSYESSTQWLDTNPGDAVIGGSGFRLGCTHTVATSTARIYTEPYGGGARTYLIAETAVGGGWENTEDALDIYVQSDGAPAITGGYLDNLTLTTLDAPTPIDGEAASTTAPGVSGAVGYTLTSDDYLITVPPTYTEMSSGRTDYWVDITRVGGTVGDPVGLFGGADLFTGSDAVAVAITPLSATEVRVSLWESEVETHIFTSTLAWADDEVFRLGFECLECRKSRPYIEPAGGGDRAYLGFGVITALTSATELAYTSVAQPAAAELATVPFVRATALTTMTATVADTTRYAVGQKVQFIAETAVHHVGSYAGAWKPLTSRMYPAWSNLDGESTLSLER